MAAFNERLRPLFELLRRLDGVLLAPCAAEPDIDAFVEADRGEERGRGPGWRHVSKHSDLSFSTLLLSTLTRPCPY